jgi:DNA-binding transcriptional regulator YdaS (Cro superfamily)
MLLLGVMAPCAAQNAPPARTLDPKACSEGQRLQLDSIRPQLKDPSQRAPGDKLEQTEGVICPPDVDPDIKADAPNAGRTPVIPPPGSPGGDPAVRPK